MNILMISAEMAPLVKVGGLGDAVDALARALASRGHSVKVVLPLYGHLSREDLGLVPAEIVGGLPLRVDQRLVSARYWRQTPTDAGPEVLLVESESLFGRPGVYGDVDGVGFPDTVERASVLAQAALMLPELLGWPVDVIHAHDVQAALAPIYRRRWYAGRDLPGAGATLLTIHNLAHQEIHDADRAQIAGLPESLVTYPGPLEFFGKFNLLKGAIVDADLVNTVSPTYAHEVTTDPDYGYGLEGVLAERDDEFTGILNGCDVRDWNPTTDRFLPAHFDREDLTGKAICRERLLETVGLEPGSRLLLGMVSRLVPQKGLDLVVALLGRLAAGGFSLVVLGKGEAGFEKLLKQAAERYPGRITYLSEFSESKAHLIYAGSDLFLMPSRFEPCGLGQMYALRYGTLPVVRRTGGLADTVVDVDEPRGTGFVFGQYAEEPLWGALERARLVHDDPGRWRAVVRRAMAQDFSWDRAAASYEELYARLAAG